MRRWMILFLMLGLLLPARVEAMGTGKNKIRAIWYNVYQIDLRDASAAKAKIREHFDRFEAWKIDTVFFLVKTPDGKTYFPSALAPAACPWDPLQAVIEEAHSHRMRLHPYLNVFAEEGPFLQEHPQWAETRQDGTPMQWASPAVPEVRARVHGLIEELLRYPIDGLQLDRIRYEEYPSSDAGFNPLSIREYGEKTGKPPYPEDPDFIDWKCDLVSSFVREASSKVRARGLEFSCAVYPNREKALRYASQDWNRWVDAGWLDAVYPMTYTEDPDLFRSYLVENGKNKKATTRLVMGLGAYRERMTPFMLKAQIDECLADPNVAGICFFNGYSLLREDYAGLEKN
ncbi:MAG: glycoside hydrolase family 10 protein [Bacteroidota bacterium]